MNWKDFTDNIVNKMKETEGLKNASYISAFIPLANATFPIISIEIINVSSSAYAINNIKHIYDFDVRIIGIEKTPSLSNISGSLFETLMTFIKSNPYLLHTKNGNKTCVHFGTGLGKKINYNLKANEYSEAFGGHGFYIDVPTRIIE